MPKMGGKFLSGGVNGGGRPNQGKSGVADEKSRSFCQLTRRPSGRIFAWAAVVLLACALALAGCGRKGDPVPPINKREPVKEKSYLLPDTSDGEMLAVVNTKHEIRISKQIRNSNVRMTETSLHWIA
jgi:predicted small lipoprotein YifL